MNTHTHPKFALSRHVLQSEPNSLESASRYTALLFRNEDSIQEPRHFGALDPEELDFLT
jgi:hypothetical protein